MTKRIWVGLALCLVIPGLMFTTSCAKKKIESEPGMAAEKQTDSRVASADDERARQRALEEQRIQEERLRQEAQARRIQAERDEFLEDHILFEYDKSRLTYEAKANLKRKAKWLMDNSNVNIIIEGHCDERGTSEYNLALGDRRAQSAKGYLIDLGIGSHRLTSISYGEERPLDPGNNERAWAKNRRAQFVID